MRHVLEKEIDCMEMQEFRNLVHDNENRDQLIVYIHDRFCHMMKRH
mgnify:CR=1 FL=1